MLMIVMAMLDKARAFIFFDSFRENSMLVMHKAAIGIKAPLVPDNIDAAMPNIPHAIHIILLLGDAL
ncbi:hypothetical protein A9J41_06435 [Laribacter hongkongensis]|nr:hypothetical protein [Laribacter hongkongensis]